MPIFYQKRDAEFIDYEPWLICKKPKFYIRGPKLNPEDLNQGNYFSVVGAAETVGIHAEQPYGTILSNHFKIPCLNLGKGGVGLAFFNQPEKKEIIDYINKGKFLIVTLMSGRQTGNSLFKTRGGTCKCFYNNEEMPVERVWELITETYWDDKAFLEKFVLEVRTAYVDEYIQFLNKIDVPVILFYFSQRTPKYSFNWQKKHVSSLWDKFPHFVDDTTIGEILAKPGDGIVYAECVSRKGIPYILKDKAGKTISLWYPRAKEFRTKHSYYPSPEMHKDAAEVLEPICRRIL